MKSPLWSTASALGPGRENGGATSVTAPAASTRTRRFEVSTVAITSPVTGSKVMPETVPPRLLASGVTTPLDAVNRNSEPSLPSTRSPLTGSIRPADSVVPHGWPPAVTSTTPPPTGSSRRTWLLPESMSTTAPVADQLICETMLTLLVISV